MWVSVWRIPKLKKRGVCYTYGEVRHKLDKPHKLDKAQQNAFA